MPDLLANSAPSEGRFLARGDHRSLPELKHAGAIAAWSPRPDEKFLAPLLMPRSGPLPEIIAF